jgi:hypothetical protein
MPPEVKEQSAIVIADEQTDQVLYVTGAIERPGDYPTLSLANGEPFFEVIGGDRLFEVVEFAAGIGGFLSIDDQAVQGGDLF